MFYVYTNHTKHFFKLKIKLPIKLILDFEKFKNINSNFKIIMFFIDEIKVTDFNFLKQLSLNSNFVFLFSLELWLEHITIMQECKILKNLIWFRPGFLNIDNNINMKFYGGWFYYEKELYKNIPHKLQEIDSYNIKNYHFEALLGKKRIHKDFIFEKYENCNFKNKITLKYCNPDSNDWFMEPSSNYIQSFEEKNNSSIITEYYGKHCLAAQIIPIKIYNDCAFSIVAETGFVNDYSYITEKTVKPIFGRRLFIIFSGANFLKNLHSLGFKTFDGIIDESYDKLLNNEERWAAAWQQVEWLCNQDQQEIYEKIKPICEHNYNLMMETEWFSIVGKKIENIITQ
jgi:hypothetical protein